MLAKQYRLTRKQIGLIHKKGRRFSMGKIGIKYTPNQQEHARYAINISTSVYKNATDRNRLRRIVYEEVGKLNLKPYDFMIGIFSPLEEKDARAQIQKIFKQIAL